MKNTTVTLAPLEAEDREQFILDNQESFKYGAAEEFGLRDDHFEEDGEIISRATIEQSIDAPDSEAYRILYDGRKVGGVVLKIDNETHHNELELLFVSPKEHSKGICKMFHFSYIIIIVCVRCVGGACTDNLKSINSNKHRVRMLRNKIAYLFAQPICKRSCHGCKICVLRYFIREHTKPLLYSV